MCGACGSSAGVWTERLAPLDGRGPTRRARALTALLAGSDRATRGVRVSPRPGGAWWLHRPGGDGYARSLPDALTELTRRLGPLVPVACGDPVAVALEGEPGRDAAAVWCAALRAASPRGELVVVAAGHRVELATEGGVSVHPAAELAPTVRGPGADRLAVHWATWSSHVVDHPAGPGTSP